MEPEPINVDLNAYVAQLEAVIADQAVQIARAQAAIAQLTAAAVAAEAELEVVAEEGGRA